MYSAKTITIAVFAAAMLQITTASAEIFTELGRTAPRSQGIFTTIDQTAPRSVFTDLDRTAPRTDGVFGTLQKGAP